jgi:hypothetical protein
MPLHSCCRPMGVLQQFNTLVQSISCVLFFVLYVCMYVASKTCCACVCAVFVCAQGCGCVAAVHHADAVQLHRST